ncbi:3-hydroxyisobutyryl-CoA hydrolase [Blattella germanica]|nr:3-hydroxyisobutyryl-CoA hydrolase [Blattella germanica]
MVLLCRSSLTSHLRYQKISTVVSAARRQMSSGEESDVIFQSVNNKGVITLNRPKALNALNLQMVRKIYPTLKKWEQEKSMVIIKGAGEKAFCAGGDVRALAEAGLKGNHIGKTFFKEEYTLNGLIGTYCIPYVALIDGITMGGGVGLSVHGPYRVATERTVFAMPETTIGLFSDVGGSYFLSRLGGKLGLYLAVTGYRLKGLDVLKAGIATHYCESSKLPELEKKLLDCQNPDNDVRNILDKATKESKIEGYEFSLAPHLKQIDECFSAPTMEEIFARLEKDGSEWAVKTLEGLRKVSPTSCKVIKKELEEGATKSLQECLTMEFRLGSRFCDRLEFYEGVRALLIDKDQKPNWNPKRLEDVTDELVDSHFAPLPPDEELKL